ncbi:MAG TPA: YgaP-like transmembrane domain [Flavisolibacter sp.]|jgi:uncharacterized membrane protein|nr:YgaP-like transmembrane domain [Flavisolibacter sp.]
MTNTENNNWQSESEFQPQLSGGLLNVGQTERMVSVGLGAFLLSSGLHNLTSHPLKGLIRTVLGGVLLYRGVSGHCPMYESLGKTKGASHTSSINIRTGLIVNKPRQEVYAFWRKLENLPLFMKHLANVTEIDSKHSHWEAEIPGGMGKVKWNAEIVKEQENEFIGWQSVPDSMVNNAGKVTFRDALGGEGTELDVVITYRAPAGELGAGIAKRVNPVLEKMVRQDIMNFKEYIETKHASSSNYHTHSSGSSERNDPNILRTESESVAEGSGSNNTNSGSTFGSTGGGNI